MLSTKLARTRATEAGTSSKRQKKAPSAKSSSKSNSKTTFMYLVKAEEYGPYREETTHTTIGIYSTKKLALTNARVAFEEKFSNGRFQDGKFTEPPRSFDEEQEDDSKNVTGEEGSTVVYHQCDAEGDGEKITMEKIAVDQPYT